MDIEVENRNLNDLVLEDYLDGHTLDEVGYINCQNNNLTHLPDLHELESLEVLNCSHNQLQNLPRLPNDLYQLDCDHNVLESLNGLPDNLSELNCQNNHLTRLPEKLSEMLKLKRIVCSHNQITKLDHLPHTLYDSLLCDNNQLTEFNPPPHVKQILCHNNQIEEITQLNKFVNTFSCARNPLKKLFDLSTFLSKCQSAEFNLTISVYQVDLLPDKIPKKHLKKLKLHILDEDSTSYIYPPTKESYEKDMKHSKKISKLMKNYGNARFEPNN